MSIKTIGATLAAITIGCSSPEGSPPNKADPNTPHVYNVVIDSSFTIAQKTAILDALDEWGNYGATRIAVTVTEAQHGELVSAEDAPYVRVLRQFDSNDDVNGNCPGADVRPVSPIGEFGEIHGDWTVCITDFDSYLDTVDDATRVVALHEFGHMFGLGHRDNSIMMAVTDFSVQHINDIDKSQFDAVHPWPTK